MVVMWQTCLSTALPALMTFSLHWNHLQPIWSNLFLDTIEDVHWQYLAHEQAAAVLHTLSYQNPTIQSEMVSCGTIKHLVKLCDMFDPMGCHSNCCYSVYQCSKDANQLLHDLTFQKKLVGKVKELSLDALREKAVNLVRTGEQKTT